jgi:hypothetical protein
MLRFSKKMRARRRKNRQGKSMGMNADGEGKPPMTWIGAALIVLFVFFFFLGGEYALLLGCLFTPWCYVLGIFLSGKMTLLDTRKRNPAPIPFMVSIFLIGMLAAGIAHLRHPEYLLFFGAVPGLILWLAFYVATLQVDVALRPSTVALVLLGIPCWIYGGSALALANRLLETQPPQAYQASVAGKRVEHGKGVSYYLELSDWGPGIHGSEILVDQGQYAAAKVGDPLCMGIYPGRFGLQWTDRVQCTDVPSE